jgi:S-adenosyl-L-methionine hydrolase (adenosine-forming)
MTTKIITLTTDFGLRDPYVAEMKAAILGICPSATMLDVTHEVEKFNTRAGAFMLASVAPYFPAGTIHVAVIDPSVGTQRRPIIIETKQSFFIGPDNGVLMLAAEAQGIINMREIASRRLMLPHVSSTFHGRDIFAPAAAHLANGTSPEEFGPQITVAVTPPFITVTRTHDAVSGEVLHVDDFGNIITNIPAKDVAAFKGSMVQVELPAQTQLMKVSGAYADVKLHEAIILVGSHSYAEIALNQGSAAMRFQVKAGDKVALKRM